MKKRLTYQEAVRLRIIELADEKGLSHNKIADNSFINTSTITSIINRHSKSSETRTIGRIMYGLGIEIKDFYNSPLFDNIDYLEED